MATLPLIGQAVVTDPGTTGASGYTLVAWSPTVTAEDRAHLARMPQVSDYLHVESSPRVFFSFYRLPGGSWAFGKRFARGTRRGSYNRIVVYTVILPGGALEALEWDPWVLPACHFRAAGQERSFQDLTEWGEEIPRALPDLQMAPPADTTAKRHEILESRRRYLEGRWSRDDFATALAQALGALEQGSGLLLPQSIEHEQLLALAWSALPRRDRVEIPWTTHLAPGGLDLFRLANAPSPDDTRATAGPSWSVLREARQGPGSSTVASALVDGKPPWLLIDREWYESTDERALSLLRNGNQVKRWTVWVERGGPPVEGFATVGQLEAYFDTHAVDRSAVADPWESSVALLALAARTASNLQGEGSGTKGIAAVYRLLVDRGLTATILTPQRFDELLGLQVDAGALEAALGLCLRVPEQDKAKLLIAALTASRRSEALAASIAARHLVPALAATPGAAPLLGEHLDFALRALSSAPEGLSEALRSWRESLYDRAVKELKRWLKEAPQAVRQASVSWNEESARERDSILSLAEALASAGVPAERWLPFALAEAAVLDRTDRASDVVRFSNNVSFPAGPVRQTGAVRLCQRLNREDIRPGPAHRSLVLALANEIAAQPDEAVAVLSSFAQRPEPVPDSDVRAWGGPIAAVADALHRRGFHQEASALGRNWLKQVAVIPWNGLPQEALGLRRLVSDADRKEVTSVWLPHLSKIRPEPETAEVFAALRDWLLVDPKLRREFEISEILSSVREGRMALPDAVAECMDRVGRKERAEILLEVLGKHLPPRQNERLQALFDLALSPRLFPSDHLLIQEKFLWSAVPRAGRDLLWVLPPVSDLARRKGLLLRVFRRAGQIWQEDPFTCYDRLKEAIRLKHLDAVASFLHGTRSVRRPFLEVLASKEGDEHLLNSLRWAVRERPAARELASFLPDITGIKPPKEDA